MTTAITVLSDAELDAVAAGVRVYAFNQSIRQTTEQLNAIGPGGNGNVSLTNASVTQTNSATQSAQNNQSNNFRVSLSF
jgi:hypothetical protein